MGCDVCRPEVLTRSANGNGAYRRRSPGAVTMSDTFCIGGLALQRHMAGLLLAAATLALACTPTPTANPTTGAPNAPAPAAATTPTTTASSAAPAGSPPAAAAS